MVGGGSTIQKQGTLETSHQEKKLWIGGIKMEDDIVNDKLKSLYEYFDQFDGDEEFYVCNIKEKIEELMDK